MIICCIDRVKGQVEIDELFEKLLEILPIGEQRKIHRFVQKRDRHASLIGQVMARWLITKSIPHISLEDVQIARNEKGRPYCASFHGDFNVSHHGQHVIAGLVEKGRIGIDITEISKELPPFSAFGDVFSSDVEWPFIKGGSCTWEQSKRFSLLWALKEAYVKCTGEGITVDLSLISFQIRPVVAHQKVNLVRCWDDSLYQVELYLQGNHLQDWKFEAWMIDNVHIAAIAIHSSDPNNLLSDIPETKWISPRDLLN